MIKYCLLCIYLMGTVFLSAQQPAYKNKNLSPEARAADLIKKMTLDEKVMQTQCLWIQKSRILNATGDFDEVKAKDALMNGLGELGRLNEQAGPNSSGYHPKQAAELYNKIQKYFVEKTRLGIPVMVHEESLHGQQTQDATNFPIPIGLASTWNENLMTEIFTNVAEEVRARGGQHVLAPVVDTKTSHRAVKSLSINARNPCVYETKNIAFSKRFCFNKISP